MTIDQFTLNVEANNTKSVLLTSTGRAFTVSYTARRLKNAETTRAAGGYTGQHLMVMSYCFPQGPVYELFAYDVYTIPNEGHTRTYSSRRNGSLRNNSRRRREHVTWNQVQHCTGKGTRNTVNGENRPDKGELLREGGWTSDDVKKNMVVQYTSTAAKTSIIIIMMMKCGAFGGKVHV